MKLKNLFRFLWRRIRRTYFCLFVIAFVLYCVLLAYSKFFPTWYSQNILYQNVSPDHNQEELRIYHRPKNFSQPGVVDDIIGMKAIPFSNRFKNPCWYEKPDGKTLTLRCLPYFYLVGVDKCGTTDLFSRLLQHQELLQTSALNGKETHWWSWRRFGYDVFTRNGRLQSFEDYLNVFDIAAKRLNDSSGNLRSHIICDGSPTVFWDFTGWPFIPQNKGLEQPKVLTPHCISHLTPNVKFILLLRNPIERLFSDYLFIKRKNVSVEDFDKEVKNSWNELQKCTETLDIRLCLFDKSLHMKTMVRLLIGMYSYYLSEWFKVFPRQQFLIIRTEDYKADMSGTLKKVFEFLQMDPLEEKTRKQIASGDHVFERTEAHKKLGPMLLSTKKFLYEIYRYSMEELSLMLNDKRFLWDDL
ncbi:carbohydrate sulfotransferase 15 [Octopus sinensis]|uniref:Carbohydrate sulfotransferase 15 n=1 Tax=Octopus sinensis TaxID=2607531 RepID=A0A6P7T9D4_9MOLL|nr:carbohydrate sulfotransferase 15 [Octopus sinensis]